MHKSSVAGIVHNCSKGSDFVHCRYQVPHLEAIGAHTEMDHPKYVIHNKKISTHDTGQIILPYIVTGTGSVFVT